MIVVLYSILNRLPAQHREVLLMYLEGADTHVVAQKLGISEEMVHNRKREACLYLRKHSEDAWGVIAALLMCGV